MEESKTKCKCGKMSKTSEKWLEMARREVLASGGGTTEVRGERLAHREGGAAEVYFDNEGRNAKPRWRVKLLSCIYGALLKPGIPMRVSLGLRSDSSALLPYLQNYL